MNYFLLQDLSEGTVDAIIVTSASKEEIEEAIRKAKEVDDYTWEHLIESMPDNTKVIDCMNANDRIFY